MTNAEFAQLGIMDKTFCIVSFKETIKHGWISKLELEAAVGMFTLSYKVTVFGR